MRISKNFDIREFVPKETWDKWGVKSVWFIDNRIPLLAQGIKEFLVKCYVNKDPNIVDVQLNVNNWHLGGQQQLKGYRPPTCTIGGKESQHRFGRGFDADIILVYKNGTKKEVPVAEIHGIIKANWSVFKSLGLTTIESVKDAPTWMHFDIRDTGMEELFIVNAIK